MACQARWSGKRRAGVFCVLDWNMAWLLSAYQGWKWLVQVAPCVTTTCAWQSCLASSTMQIFGLFCWSALDEAAAWQGAEEQALV